MRKKKMTNSMSGLDENIRHMAIRQTLDLVDSTKLPKESILFFVLTEVLKSHAIPDEKIELIKQDFLSTLTELVAADERDSLL